MIYKCNYFKIQELVDKDTYELLGDQAWKLLDNNLLILIDKLREKFGSATINNWNIGGNFSKSGFRVYNEKIGAKKSLHKFGLACDLKFSNYTAEKIRQEIRSNEEFWKQYISRIENDVNWLHVDLKDFDSSKNIYWFNP